MIFEVIHRTTFQYTTPVSLSQNEACLQARNLHNQKLLKFYWETNPEADYVDTYIDFFGNHRQTFFFERPHQQLSISYHQRIEIKPPSPQTPSEKDTYRSLFLLPSPHIPLYPFITDWARSCFKDGQPSYEGLIDLTQKIFQTFKYDPQATTVSTRIDEFFSLKRGVCQDYAQLMISALRGLGIPACYVSGYINTLPPPGKEKIWGADASHAWVSAYLDGYGWIDVDPTNGILVSDNHITVSWGRDYGDVTPLKGVVLGGGAQTLKVEVTVYAVG